MNINQILESINEYAKHFYQYQQRKNSLTAEDIKEEVQNIILKFNDLSAEELSKLAEMLLNEIDRIQENIYIKAKEYGRAIGAYEIAMRNTDGFDIYSCPSIWGEKAMKLLDELKSFKNISQVYSSFIRIISISLLGKVNENPLNQNSSNEQKIKLFRHLPTDKNTN